MLETAATALNGMTFWAGKDERTHLRAALAAKSIPATLAAWAAAALRARRHAALPRLRAPMLKLITWSWAVSVGGWPLMASLASRSDAGGSAGCLEQLRALPGGDIMMLPATDLAAADFERMATEILPQGAARLRAARDDAGAEPQRALAEARALATRPCANPRCVKIVGCREREARGKLCSGCKVSRHCCRECQVAGWKWKAHKGVCGALKAAAAREAGEEAAAAEAGGGA
jgi:hypothetical protein